MMHYFDFPFSNRFESVLWLKQQKLVILMKMISVIIEFGNSLIDVVILKVTVTYPFVRQTD